MKFNSCIIVAIELNQIKAALHELFLPFCWHNKRHLKRCQMLSDVSFSFYFVTSSAEADTAAGGLFSPVPLRTPVHVCVYISASIILSYRCNQRRVSIKVFAWGLRGSTGGRLHSGGKCRHSLIHGRSMRQWGGVQILPLWYQRPHIPGFGNMECVYQHVFFFLYVCVP